MVAEEDGPRRPPFDLNLAVVLAPPGTARRPALEEEDWESGRTRGTVRLVDWERGMVKMGKRRAAGAVSSSPRLMGGDTEGQIEL